MGSGQSKKGGPEPVKSIEYKNNPEATVEESKSADNSGHSTRSQETDLTRHYSNTKVAERTIAAAVESAIEEVDNEEEQDENDENAENEKNKKNEDNPSIKSDNVDNDEDKFDEIAPTNAGNKNSKIPKTSASKTSNVKISASKTSVTSKNFKKAKMLAKISTDATLEQVLQEYSKSMEAWNTKNQELLQKIATGEKTYVDYASHPSLKEKEVIDNYERPRKLKLQTVDRFTSKHSQHPEFDMLGQTPLIQDIRNLDTVYNSELHDKWVQVEDIYGRLPIHVACELGRIDFVKNIVTKMDKSNTSKPDRTSVRTPLGWAVYRRRLEIVNYLICDVGPETVCKNALLIDTTGWSLLSIDNFKDVYLKCNDEVKEFFAKLHIHVNHAKTSVFEDIELIGTQVSQECLSASTFPKPYLPFTFHWGSFHSEEGKVQTQFYPTNLEDLLDNSHPVDGFDWLGLKPAHLQVVDTNSDVLECNKLDAAVLTRDGQNSFHLAAGNGSLQIFRLLMELKNSVKSIELLHAQDNFGRTPLLIALKNGNLDIVELILNTFPAGAGKNMAGENENEKNNETEKSDEKEVVTENEKTLSYAAQNINISNKNNDDSELLSFIKSCTVSSGSVSIRANWKRFKKVKVKTDHSLLDYLPTICKYREDVAQCLINTYPELLTINNVTDSFLNIQVHENNWSTLRLIASKLNATDDQREIKYKVMLAIIRNSKYGESGHSKNDFPFRFQNLQFGDKSIPDNDKGEFLREFCCLPESHKYVTWLSITATDCKNLEENFKLQKLEFEWWIVYEIKWWQNFNTKLFSLLPFSELFLVHQFSDHIFRKTPVSDLPSVYEKTCLNPIFQVFVPESTTKIDYKLPIVSENCSGEKVNATEYFNMILMRPLARIVKSGLKLKKGKKIDPVTYQPTRNEQELYKILKANRAIFTAESVKTCLAILAQFDLFWVIKHFFELSKRESIVFEQSTLEKLEHLQHTSNFSIIPMYLQDVKKQAVLLSYNSVRYASADSILRGLVYSDYSKTVGKLRGWIKWMNKYDQTKQLNNVFSMINHFPCEPDKKSHDWYCFLEAALYRGSHLMANMIFNLDPDYYTSAITTQRRVSCIKAAISSGQLKAVRFGLTKFFGGDRDRNSSLEIMSKETVVELINHACFVTRKNVDNLITTCPSVKDPKNQFSYKGFQIKTLQTMKNEEGESETSEKTENGQIELRYPSCSSRKLGATVEILDFLMEHMHRNHSLARDDYSNMICNEFFDVVCAVNSHNLSECVLKKLVRNSVKVQDDDKGFLEKCAKVLSLRGNLIRNRDDQFLDAIALCEPLIEMMDFNCIKRRNDVRTQILRTYMELKLSGTENTKIPDQIVPVFHKTILQGFIDDTIDIIPTFVEQFSVNTPELCIQAFHHERYNYAYLLSQKKECFTKSDSLPIVLSRNKQKSVFDYVENFNFQKEDGVLDPELVLALDLAWPNKFPFLLEKCSEIKIRTVLRKYLSNDLSHHNEKDNKIITKMFDVLLNCLVLKFDKAYSRLSQIIEVETLEVLKVEDFKHRCLTAFQTSYMLGRTDLFQDNLESDVDGHKSIDEDKMVEQVMNSCLSSEIPDSDLFKLLTTIEKAIKFKETKQAPWQLFHRLRQLKDKSPKLYGMFLNLPEGYENIYKLSTINAHDMIIGMESVYSEYENKIYQFKYIQEILKFQNGCLDDIKVMPVKLHLELGEKEEYTVKTASKRDSVTKIWQYSKIPVKNKKPDRMAKVAIEKMGMKSPRRKSSVTDSSKSSPRSPRNSSQKKVSSPRNITQSNSKLSPRNSSSTTIYHAPSQAKIIGDTFIVQLSIVMIPTPKNKSSKLQVQPFSKCSNTMEQLAETCVATCSHEKHYRLPTHFGVIEMLDEKDGDKFTIEDYQRKFLINPETPVYKTLIRLVHKISKGEFQGLLKCVDPEFFDRKIGSGEKLLRLLDELAIDRGDEEEGCDQDELNHVIEFVMEEFDAFAEELMQKQNRTNGSKKDDMKIDDLKEKVNALKMSDTKTDDTQTRNEETEFEKRENETTDKITTNSTNYKTNEHSGFGPLLTLALLRKLDVAFYELLKFVCAKDGREFTKNSKTDVLQQLKGWIYEFDGNPIELAILIGDRNDLFNSEAGYVRKEELKQARKVIHEILWAERGVDKEEDNVNSEQPKSKIQSETQISDDSSDEVETKIDSEKVDQSEKEDGEQEGSKTLDNRAMKEKSEEEKQKRENLLLEHLRFI